MTALPSRARPSDDRGHDRSDDRDTRADADADTDRNRDLPEREATRCEADQAAREAEDRDDLAARAFEKVRELGQRRGEGRVGAGIGGAGGKCGDGQGDGKVDGLAEAVCADAPGKGEGLHMELRLEG